MIVIRNDDQPGVIGEIGTILGRHGVNIANFALGRVGPNAIGPVIVDETAPIPGAVLDDLRKVQAIREVRIVRVWATGAAYCRRAWSIQRLRSRSARRGSHR